MQDMGGATPTLFSSKNLNSVGSVSVGGSVVMSMPMGSSITNSSSSHSRSSHIRSSQSHAGSRDQMDQIEVLEEVNTDNLVIFPAGLSHDSHSSAGGEGGLDVDSSSLMMMDRDTCSELLLSAVSNDDNDDDREDELYSMFSDSHRI